MNTCEANKRVIEQLIERVWREGHIDELPDFWTADCINHADPAPEKRGLAAVRLYHEGFAQWFRDFDNVKIEVQQQVAESDRVVTQIVLRTPRIGGELGLRGFERHDLPLEAQFCDHVAGRWRIPDRTNGDRTDS